MKNLVAHRRPHDFPVSRDWAAPDVPCRVISCPAYHNGYCTMPSAIKINAMGKCELGMKSMEREKQK